VSGLTQGGACPVVPVRRDEDGLWLFAAREHDLLAEQSHLRDDLGQVRACLGHAHAHFAGLRHALRIHTRPTGKSVALYNSVVGGTAEKPSLSRQSAMPRPDQRTDRRQPVNVDLNFLFSVLGQTKASLRVDDGKIVMTYVTEADARSAFGQLAEVYGWIAEEEVVIPGWGRVDLVLRSAHAEKPLLIELKRELRKPSEIRKAFQQADGYGRWWSTHRSESATSILVGIQTDWSRVRPVADAYPEVGVLDGPTLMDRLINWDRSPDHRALRAHDRLARLTTLLEVHRHAVDQLDALHHSRLNSSEVDSA
jgi:hypothetical protein